MVLKRSTGGHSSSVPQPGRSEALRYLRDTVNVLGKMMEISGLDLGHPKTFLN